MKPKINEIWEATDSLGTHQFLIVREPDTDDDLYELYDLTKKQKDSCSPEYFAVNKTNRVYPPAPEIKVGQVYKKRMINGTNYHFVHKVDNNRVGMFVYSGVFNITNFVWWTKESIYRELEFYKEFDTSDDVPF